jgi:hypothetical protein
MLELNEIINTMYSAQCLAHSKNSINEPGVVAHTCNSSIQDLEAEGS